MLAQELEKARARTDDVFARLRPESLYVRPVAERHRLIFYLGHVEAFDWNLVARTTLGVPSFDPTLDQLFAFGIDPEPGQGPADQPSDWPRVEEVRGYNHRVRQEIDRLLPAAPQHIARVAIEHRMMHAETLAYLLHNLPAGEKLGEPPRATTPRPAPSNPMIEVPAGRATLGLHRGNGFGWDNEFDAHPVDVPAFRIAKHKVTNGEYLRFVRDGAPAPHFWIVQNGDFFYHGAFGEIPLPLAWPVYTTHDEATAYAKWAGGALPTEAQWHRAAEGSRPVNVDFERWDPVPVDATPEGDSIHGVAQMAGNGWEWTSSVFAPFPGFERFAFYPGYSIDFFDGRHFVMKGGSPRTAACLMRASFRNWFRPNYPCVYAGFRLMECAR